MHLSINLCIATWISNGFTILVLHGMGITQPTWKGNIVTYLFIYNLQRSFVVMILLCFCWIISWVFSTTQWTHYITFKLADTNIDNMASLSPHNVVPSKAWKDKLVLLHIILNLPLHFVQIHHNILKIYVLFYQYEFCKWDLVCFPCNMCMQDENAEAAEYLLQRETIPLCLNIMEMGNEPSKTVCS